MPPMKEGIMVILSSPSGAGKTTLVKLLSERKGFITSISHTTRTPRSNEVDGEDYHFVNIEKFEKMIGNKEFLEYAKVFKNFYGTTKSTIFEELKKGNNVIFDIDWQGTRQIRNKKLNYRLLTIFILPPSRNELLKRLIKRENKNLKTVKKRMKEFKKDLSKWKEYDYVVINDNLNVCYKKIMSVIKSKNILTYNHKYISEHVKELLT